MENELPWVGGAKKRRIRLSLASTRYELGLLLSLTNVVDIKKEDNLN